MSPQQLSDRFEIRALIVRYSNALDARRFELLDEVFTPDAYIDYRATGGIEGHYPHIRKWLPPAVTAFPHMCHLVGNIGITLDGDRASPARARFKPESGRGAAAGRRIAGHVPSPCGIAIDSCAHGGRVGAWQSECRKRAYNTTCPHRSGS